jgi:hypothetical protein
MKRKFNVALFTKLAFAMLLLGAAANVFSQHCPFDGGSMIVVQLTDAEDKPLFGSAADLTLSEVDNPEADSCSFTKGLLSRAFLPPVDAFMQRYARHGSENFRTYCEDCAFNADGFYAVIIGQSEQSCMIKKDDDTDYRYVKRKFEIRYKRDNVEQTVAVPPNKIFSMCTGAGKWSRFEPIKLRLESAKIKE